MQTVFRIVRVGLGLLVLSSIVSEIVTLSGWSQFNPGNFFSFFTIQSNIIAAIVLIAFGLFYTRLAKSVVFQSVRGAATLYMAMTGVIFAVLLSGLTDVRLTAVPWNNIVLHYIMPIAMVIDWLISPPKVHLKTAHIAAWVLLPIGYVVYSLIRGYFVGWYPYPFLNPVTSSYEQVGLTLAVLTVGVLLGAWAFLWYARRVGRPVVYKHSAGGVVLHDGNVLLIHWDAPRDSHDFPKGSLMRRESSEQACIREVKEETGYDTRILNSLGQTNYEYAWKDGTYIKKRVDYFLLELIGSPDNSTPKRERHERFVNAWVPIEVASEKITRAIDKEILQKALEVTR